MTRRHIEENVLNHAVVYTSKQAKWYLIAKIQNVILFSFTVSLGKLRFYKSALRTLSKILGTHIPSSSLGATTSFFERFDLLNI